MTVAHLPESAAAPWPNLDEYRPPGWRSPLSPAQVVARLAAIKAAQSGLEWSSAKLAREAAILTEHVGILRQCWTTRLHVWRLAEYLIGPPEVDPFANAWSQIHQTWSGVRLLDGNDGRDGFDLTLWGRVGERGRTAYVNGPHDDTGGYVSLSVRAANEGHAVAVVVPLDGCKWFAGAGAVVTSDVAAEDQTATTPRDVASCDVLAIPEGGRMSFMPAPGVKASSPNKGYGLAVWGVAPELMARLFANGPAVRVTFGGHAWVLLRGCGDAGRIVRTIDLDT